MCLAHGVYPHMWRRERSSSTHMLCCARLTVGGDKVRAVGNGTGILNSNGAGCGVELSAGAEAESEYEVIFMHSATSTDQTRGEPP